MHLITRHETLQNSLKILIKIRSKTLSKLSRSPSSISRPMTAVYSPQKVVPSLSRPFTRWHTLHPTGDQPFVTRSLDFPFSARFHRDDTDTSSPRRPSFPSSSLPSPLVTPPPPSMRRGETILRRRRDRTRRWCLFSVRSSASDTDTALERYSSIRGEGSFSPPQSSARPWGGRSFSTRTPLSLSLSDESIRGGTDTIHHTSNL